MAQNEHTPNYDIELPDIGGDSDNWGQILNNAVRSIDAIMAGLTAGGISGGIFITDIAPAAGGNVGSKVTRSDGLELISCTSDDGEIAVSVMAISGGTTLLPSVTVNGISVTLTQLPDQPMWAGTVDITLGASGDVTAIHSDGPINACDVTIQVGPEVSGALFGALPGTQTELKEGDVVNLVIDSVEPMIGIEVEGFGACQASSHSFASTTNTTIQVTIANRGTTLQNLTARIQAVDASGSLGAAFETGNTLPLNNLHPTVSFGITTYPGAQEALKDSETASVVITTSDLDVVLFDSPSAELLITNPSVVEASKTVERISGNYNVSVDNLRATATRTANDASTVENVIIQIAHVDMTVDIAVPAARLRSGGNAGTVAQDHIITVTGNQEFLQPPTMVAPSGTFQGAAFAGGPMVWTRDLQVHDDDVKGSHAWGSFDAVNLAGKVINVPTNGVNYIIGGFVLRTLTISAWPNREVAIETSVLDVMKLECTNLSKSPSGSLNFDHRADQDDTLDEYTILDGLGGSVDPQGTVWYNCDLPNAVSNTAGTMQAELEEVI